jgi:5-methyltetrahydrofolate--homocysteine methyltransferase
MGSLIQGLHLTEGDFRGERFADHRVNLLGCNDLLCLTRPELISGIHEDYLKAGADITKTCSFNATAISLEHFGLEGLAYEISRAAAALARKAADRFSTPEKPRFVAGSIGPTAKSGSLSSDINLPEKRAVTWDELVPAYYDNVRGLVDGGADILLVETIFDTLNAKAAIFAVGCLLAERRIDVPLMLSATVASGAQTGGGGRILSGQTLEAFCISVSHAGPWAMGLNCSFGAEALKDSVAELGTFSQGLGGSWLISAHPNAGLPNQLGGYDESPESMASKMESYFKEGLLNIAGGCCGTTPAHIAAIAEAAKGYPPRKSPQPAAPSTWLSALTSRAVGKKGGLSMIGERTNVAGSRKFLKFIKDENYDDALTVAAEMIERGAALIDICMDDALLDGEKAMGNFLNFALQDPEIARVPIMIDSSRWNVIEAGLKCVQGKCLVNSISLKEGPEEFLRRAWIARSYGAAVVVMLFDEQGQAAEYERKIEVARRSWELLRDSGFPPQDIVFDPNVLAVATGIPKHDSYGLDFIRACAWIHDNCPGAQISGGISNLSFSFRGNDRVREAMHAVFLKYAAEAGLSMAIVNPASLVEYDSIDGELRRAAEDLILNRNTAPSGPDSGGTSPAERLLGLAEKIASEGDLPSSLSSGVSSGASSGTPSGAPETASGGWRGQDAGERIVYAMIRGIDDYIEEDVLEFRRRCGRSLEIVEGPLMRGMREVGDRFGAGKMFLPQLIRSARVMKKAVAVLTPFMEREKNQADGDTGGAEETQAAIVLATVRGDVHDIGKNIVAVVLGCNGYKIRDLGVMVEAETILDTARREGAAAIGVSGLITPSLDEMVHIAAEMEKQRFTIPLLVGGAAASLAHTALRIAPEYSGPVVYTQDAAQCPGALSSLLSPASRPRFLADLETRYREAAARHEAIHSRIEVIPLEAARANRVPVPAPAAPPNRWGLIDLNGYPLDRVIPRINWDSFLESWEFKPGRGGPGDKAGEESREEDRTARTRLLEDAREMLDRVQAEQLLRLRGVLGIFPAAAREEDVLVYGGDAGAVPPERFSFLRGQDRKRNGVHNPCLADFLPPEDGWIGLFALSAGFGAEEAAAACRGRGDDYGAILLGTLANSLTEAFSEEAHRLVAEEYWGYAAGTGGGSANGAYGIRPAFGYPSCPDHRDKETAFRLLEARQRCGLDLTESAMLRPAASVCGMYIPGGFYFSIAATGEDQLAGWARRKGIGREEARQRLASILPLAKTNY